MLEILSLSAVELGKKIAAGEITSVEATKAYLDEIGKKDKEINAYVTVDTEGALRAAEEADKMIAAKKAAGEPLSPFAGVPVAIKDNMCIEGMLTSCSSHILDNFYPTYTSTAVQQLKDAGAVILGHTNMDEFAMGSTSETSYYGPTKNPWNLGHVPGGSSGGSAAAVAADECAIALGSDTGGSIRQPASFCGVTGIKPTYGRVSRYGLIAYGSSLDQIGPLGKNVEDCAAMLEVISGHDPKDSTSAGGDEESKKDARILDNKFTDALIDDVKGMKIGVPRDYFLEGIDEDVKSLLCNCLC